MAETTNRIQYIIDATQAKAEADALNQKLNGTDKAARAAGAGASVGLGGVEKAAKSSGAAIAQLELLYKNVVRTQGEGSAAAQMLAAEIAAMGGATKGGAAATDKLGVTTGILGGIFEKTTSRINVGRGALAGWDAVVEAVARSMGGVTIATAVGISVFTALLPVIFKMVSGKKELVEVDEKYIALQALLATAATNATQQQQAQAAASGGLFTVLSNLSEAQQTLTGSSQQLVFVEKSLESVVANRSKQSLVVRGDMVIETERTDDLQSSLKALTTENQANTKAVAEQVEKIIAYKNVTGATDVQILAFARSHGITGDALKAVETALAQNSVEMAKYAAELAKASHESRTFEQAQLALNLALAQRKAPGFDFAATTEEIVKQGREIEQNMRAYVALGHSWEEAIISQEKNLEALNRSIQKNATANSSAGKEMETYRRTLGLIPPEVADAIKEVDRFNKGLDAFKDKSKQAAAEAEKLSRVEFQLSKEFLAAQEALGKQDFDRQRDLIRQETEERRQEYARRGQLSEIVNLQLIAIEQARLTAITNAEIKYREDAIRDHAEMLGKQRESRQKAQDQEIADLREHMAKQRQVREEEQRKQQEADDKAARERRSDRPGRAQTEADAIREADEAARKHTEALDHIDFLYGDILPKVEHYKELLERIEKLHASGAHTAELGEGIRTIAEDFLFSANAALRFGDAVENAMAQAVSSATTFGQALKAQIFGLIADMASAFGDFFIKWGAAHIFLNPAAGIAAIAAGLALKAFAGLMRGKASNATQAAPSAGGNGSSAGSAAAAPRQPVAQVFDISSRQVMDRHSEALNRHADAMTGGASASVRELDARIVRLRQLEQAPLWTGLAAGTARQAAEAERSRLLSSMGVPQIGGPTSITLINQLDPKAGKDFLDGKQVVTMHDFRGAGSNSTEVTRRVRKIAS